MKLLQRVLRGLKHELACCRISKTATSHEVYFGEFTQSLKAAISVGGSELGLGMMLFSLAVAVRAERVIEIGRFKGFSTLALASAMRFIDWGWAEPTEALQRPEVDYRKLHEPKERKLYSIDPTPTREAEERIKRNNLSAYVEFINAKSNDVDIDIVADIIFIDGDHTYEGCRRDVETFVPRHLRRDGYFILHDYYGWFDEEGRNNSPIKRVCDEIIASGRHEHILIDTCYPSFMVFRKVDQ